MNLKSLKPSVVKKSRKRVGRGESSGWGKFSGRGNNGQRSRSGGSINPTFEGGQTPYFRRIAKKGFSNHPFKVEYNIVNLSDIERVFKAGEIVNRDSLVEKGLVNSKGYIKVLGQGELKKKLSFDVDKISASAREKIISSKGEISE